jgi:phosphoglycolate phosphatase
MPSSTILLFDIDGTLLDTQGAGKIAIARAFDTVHQRPDACDHFRFGGMTDHAIVRRGLQHIGESEFEADIVTILDSYLTHLKAAMQEIPCVALDGVRACLQLAHRRQFAVGLGTGNLKAGAFLKLEEVSLGAEQFAFGGYADDSESRPELIRIAAERGALAAGVSLTEARVVVIGDTPKDIHAAQVNQFECLAVTTGGFTAGQLSSFAPSAISDSLYSSHAQEFLFGQEAQGAAG